MDAAGDPKCDNGGGQEMSNGIAYAYSGPLAHASRGPSLGGRVALFGGFVAFQNANGGVISYQDPVAP